MLGRRRNETSHELLHCPATMLTDHVAETKSRRVVRGANQWDLAAGRSTFSAKQKRGGWWRGWRVTGAADAELLQLQCKC